MGTQSQQAQAQLGMFGAMSRAGGGAGNASLLQKAGNSQNPMLLKVSVLQLRLCCLQIESKFIPFIPYLLAAAQRAQRGG